MSQVLKTLLPLIAIVFLQGCETQTTTDTIEFGTNAHADGTAHAEGDDHGHSHDNPPHGGTYADWGGGKYHVEFIVDHDKQEATVFVLGDDAQTSQPVAADEIQLAIDDPKFLVTLKASPMEGESQGTTSRFVGNHEKLGTVKELAGKIYGTVDGKAYSGDFQEGAHDH